jgi:hypothetical protein
MFKFWYAFALQIASTQICRFPMIVLIDNLQVNNLIRLGGNEVLFYTKVRRFLLAVLSFPILRIGARMKMK